MKIIITAGGTSEKIDDVRVISNFSTGKLGLAVAQTILQRENGSEDKIYYLCDKNTMTPMDDKVEVVRVLGAEGLLAAFKDILSREKIDAVIHAMAVSDYTVRTVTTVEEFKNLESCNEDYSKSGKISSEIDDLVLILKKTPKVIGEIKKLQKDTILVGFKLLTKVDKDVLLDTALKLLQKNDCDMVLANDLSEIVGDQHIGYLLSPDGTYERFESKAEIAAGIVARIEGLLEKGNKQ